MQNEETLLLNICWWGLTAALMGAALVYFVRVSKVVYTTRKQPNTYIQKKSYGCVQSLPCVIIFFWVRTPANQNQKVLVQACICFTLWFFMCFCAIVQDKTICKMNWSVYINRFISGGLDLIEDTRRQLIKIDNYLNRLSTRKRAAITLGLIAVFVVLTVTTMDNSMAQAGLLLLVAILVFLYKAAVSLHSCRRLLLFWLVYNSILATMVIVLLPFQGGSNSALGYVIFTVLFSLIWIIHAGAADDEPAKMACSIVNTMTTILVIVITVSTVWAERTFPVPEPFTEVWSMIQYYSTLILLPLVAGGYLAALLKQLQIYWGSKEETTGKKETSGQNIQK